MTQATIAQISEYRTANGAYRPARIAFVQASWHHDIVDKAREGFVAEMAKLGFPSSAIDVFKTMPQGEVPIASMGPGDIAGQVALTQKVRRTATIRARGEAVVLEFSRDTFERLLGASSPLALRFQRQIAVAGIRQLRDALKRIAAVFDTDDGKAPASARGSAAPPPDQAKAREVLALLEGAKGWDLSVETLDAVEVVSMPRHPSRRPSAY